tara:strand:+ start:16284 stop:16937 length:654 start_codon:yes stop_codon:yes gene_type:complete
MNITLTIEASPELLKILDNLSIGMTAQAQAVRSVANKEARAAVKIAEVMAAGAPPVESAPKAAKKAAKKKTAKKEDVFISETTILDDSDDLTKEQREERTTKIKRLAVREEFAIEAQTKADALSVERAKADALSVERAKADAAEKAEVIETEVVTSYTEDEITAQARQLIAASDVPTLRAVLSEVVGKGLKISTAPKEKYEELYNAIVAKTAELNGK